MHRRIDVYMPKKRHITSEADSQTRETRRHWVNAKKHHPDWPEVFSHRNHRTDQPDPALHNHQPSTTQQDSSHGKNAASAACGTEIVSRAHYRLPKFRCKPDITGWHLSLSFLGVSAKRRIFNLDFEVQRLGCLSADASLLVLAVADVLIDERRLAGDAVDPNETVPFDRRYADGADLRFDAAREGMAARLSEG